MWKDFDEIFGLNSGAENVACLHSSRIILQSKNTIGYYELTLNPSNTKMFTSTEDDYLSLYRKIRKYIVQSQDSYVEILKDKWTFEKCKSGKLHMHVQIQLKPLQEISSMGLVYDLSEYIAKLLRRKISDNQVFIDFSRVQTLPFCLQYVTHENKAMPGNLLRPEYWDNYIHKHT